MSLKEQLAEYRAGWYQRVPAERQAIMQRHIDQLRSGAIARNMLKVGDHAPAIVLENAKGATVEARWTAAARRWIWVRCNARECGSRRRKIT